MRPEHRAEEIVTVADVGHPVAHRLIDRILQRAAAGRHTLNGRAEQVHAHDIQCLAGHVVGAHVDVAFESEQCTCRGGRNTVLSRAGLGNDACFPHPLREQRLTERC